ncbi:MAG: coxB [Proteobacteria bacterium]|nr:coxB [Pseudomonadota bacterium]
MALLSKPNSAGLLLAAVAGASQAGNEVNLQQPVTTIAAQIYDMHTLMLVICLVIFIAVFGVMFYSVYAHRKSKGAVAAQFHENTTVEILWTVIPIFILLGMAWPATKTIIAMKDTSNSDITVKATGYQWKWGYDYIKGEGEGIQFYSSLKTPQEQIHNQAAKGEHYLLEVDNPLVVPVGKKIRVLTTASDVIHAWWVPAFGVKQDAIPGFIRDTWFKADKVGVYRGNCAELCGKEHGFMPIEVHVVAPEQYAAWVSEQKKKSAAAVEDSGKTFTLDELKARGEKVYATNCVACHQANGKGVPPTFPPLDGSKVVLGPKGGQIETVLNGVQRDGKQTAMAAWGKQLSDADIAAVVTYTRNTWGNATGEVVQPADVRAARGGVAPAAQAAAGAGGMPAKIYFDTGKAELPGDAQAAIKAALDYLAAHADAKVDITGYTDKSGSLDKNLELAKERAKAVREALTGAGVAEQRINMKPPATITGSGADKDARRVEINPAG